MEHRILYLDNAATSFPKPPSVIEAMNRSLRSRGGNAGRGAHALSLAAAEDLFACREEAARFFSGSPHPERVIFTGSTTHSLNLALKGLLHPGDHAVCSDMEHNAVYRPLFRMQQEGKITFDTFDTFPDRPDRTDSDILSSLASKIRDNTRLVVCAQMSNICSSALPIGKIGQFCRERGICFVVDAAQSAGCLDIDMEAMHIDALCVPGHKGLLGPQGIGLLLLSGRVVPDTLFEGGNGMDSLLGGMGDVLPERYEAGTLPAFAAAGLCAGMRFVRSIGVKAIHERECSLCETAKHALLSLPSVTVYAPHRVGNVLLFSVDGYRSEEVGHYLDRQGLCVRPGFHCSSLGHRRLGTPESGAVRVSIGVFTRRKEIDALIRAVKALP